MKTFEWQGHPSGLRCIAHAPGATDGEVAALDYLERSMQLAGIRIETVFRELDMQGVAPVIGSEGRVYPLESFCAVAQNMLFPPAPALTEAPAVSVKPSPEAPVEAPPVTAADAPAPAA